MRKFKCFDCNHTWEIIFFEEKPGVKQACPNCKSLNVQRIEKKSVQRGKTWKWYPDREEERLKKGTLWRWSTGPK
jgi:hypothetical protein